MWQIVYNQKGNKTILKPENHKLYLYERFFTDDKYIKFNKLPIVEVVSMDSMLFLLSERILFSEKIDKT